MTHQVVILIADVVFEEADACLLLPGLHQARNKLIICLLDSCNIENFAAFMPEAIFPCS